MATVYLAKDIRHDREVAIKVLHPELSASIGAERFEREIKLSAKLQHPHILGLIDSGEADGLLYYVMPFVKGESLRDRLEREGQLPIEDAVQITLEVADALGHAHAQGIVHRDIKPENILLSGGHALVADFGIARAATEAGGHKLTQTGMAVGTPVYMAPEQSVGDSIGPTADLYSLGCMLYEMLAGEPPFTAKNQQALMARHAMEAVPSIRIIRNTVPEEVEDTIFASMAKVPADRPQNAAQFAELLGMPLGATASRRTSIRHTASRRLPTGTYRTGEIPLPAWWRRPWVAAAVVLVVLGGAFAGWRLFAKSGPVTLSPAELARAKRLAVLYFDYPAANADLAPLADGLTEALIASFRAAKLDVASRNGVLPFRGTETPTDSIARKLQVGTVVQGSVAPEGSDRVRVTTWLTDAQGNDLGARSNFVVRRDSLLVAEDRVAAEASQKLRQQLGFTVDLQETQARAGNQAAWTFFRRGEKTRNDAEQLAGRDPKSAVPLLAQSDSVLQQASQADPAWIDPVIARGEVALRRAQLVPVPERPQWIEAGFKAAEQALKLDATSARAFALKGTLEYARWRALPTDSAATRTQLLAAAESDLKNAVTTDPSLAASYATLVRINYENKDVYSAYDNASKAYAADKYLSNTEYILDRLFYSSYDVEQFANAKNWCDEGDQRFPRNPNFTICHLLLMLIPDARPDAPAAWRLATHLDSFYVGRPDSVRQWQTRFAQVLAAGAIGKSVAGAPSPLADSARRVLLRARTDAKVDPGHRLPGYEAVMRAQLGDYDEAIALLKEYVAFNPDHSFNVGRNVHWWWREIRSKPGFQAIVSRQH
jgi:eukaryotic-like serine/threonine-protein kinase